MEYTTKRIEVDTGIHRLVEFGYATEPGKFVVSMRYEGRQLNPFVIYGPLAVESEARALDMVTVWTRWLYDEEKSR